MKLKDILNEITETRIKVKNLTFDIIKDIFTDKYQEPSGTRMQPDGKEGPMYRYYDAVNLTNGDGSSKVITDATALELWKSGILGIEGINPDVEVTLSSEGDQYGRNSFIDDPVFKDREEKISKSISSTYGKGGYEGD
jgi:ABC-type phosphate transport system substrate-binding protein